MTSNHDSEDNSTVGSDSLFTETGDVAKWRWQRGEKGGCGCEGAEESSVSVKGARLFYFWKINVLSFSIETRVKCTMRSPR